MSNPMHSYATDNADVNLTSAVTIFSESNSGSVPRYVVLNVLIGDGTKNLAASADTLLTFQLSNGGVQADEIERTIPSGQARARFQTDPIIWVNGETLALTCSSDQAGDTDVDVTVTAYDVAPLQPATSGRTVTVESDGMAHADTKEVAGQTASATGAVNMSNLDATISSRATPTNVSDAQTAIINAVNAVNTGAARYISIHTNAAYEIPDSGSVAYPIEIRTFDADGEPVAIDSAADPTVTVTRTTDAADLSGNLAAISSPATGVYRTTLTITQGSDSVAPLRIDASGAIATVTRSTSAYPVITDAVAVDFTATDRANLAAILEDTGTTIPEQITNRTLLAAEYGTATNQTTIINNIAALPAAVWAIATNILTTAGTIGKLIVDQFTAVLSAISGIGGGDATLAKQEEILASLGLISGATGPGERQFDWNLQVDGNPAVGVKVFITTDSPYTAANTIAGPLYTNDSGDAPTMLLNDDTVYYGWRDSSRYNFTNPVQFRYSTANARWELWNGAAYEEWT